MASEFVNAYLKKREEEKKANPSSSVSDRSQFAQEYLSKRYEGDVSGMAERADANDIYYDFVTGKSYSASQRAAARAKEASYIKPRRLQSALDAAQSMQKEADRYSNILMREPESGVLMPDYDAIVAANNSQNSLSLAARSRALAQKALADYEKEYRTQLDSYGPYIDGSGKDVAGQYNARKKAVDDANQAYEDAFADYQKKQQAADYARRQDDKRKALQNEWAQYKQIQADKSKAETDAAEAWKSYYSMLPKAEDFASNQQNAYVSMDGKRVDSADYDSDVDGSAYFRDFLMTDEELAIMTYLRNTQGDEAARRYEDSLRSTENERMGQRSLRYGADHPVLASIGSVGLNVANEIAGPVGIAKAKLSGQEVDPEAEYFQAGRLRDAMRAGVIQDMSPFGQYVYQTLMSAGADSGVNALIGLGTGTGWVGAGLAGLSGFTDMVRSIKERGASDDQALVLGTIEGLAEIVTEKMGFDRLADLLTTKAPMRGVVKKVLANTLSEFGEEGITTVINQTADWLFGVISGQETEFTGRIDAYMAKGETESEALAHAILDMAGDVGMDALGGALGGLVMGGGSAALNKSLAAIDAKIADYQFKKATGQTSQTAQETAQAQQNAQVTENQPIAGNRLETAQEADTRARIERLAQDTADAEMGEQAARQEMRQTEQQRVRQAAQTTENASAESVHNAARVYGKDAASFESHYEGGALQNYRRAFDAVYQAGKVNLSLEQVNQAGGEIVSGLSDQAKVEIWQAGRNAAASVVVPGVSKQYVGKMNHNQRAQIRILDAIGKKYGIQIDVVNSLDYGRTAGNAALVGRNHIVVASDAMNSAYVQAGVHELVHNLRRESSAYYDAFSSVVLDTLKKDGSFDLQAAIAERIQQYAEQGQQLSEEDALEEIVAEAAPAALTNREAMRAFVKENRTLAEKVRDFFVRFADELRQIAAKYGAGNSRAEVDAMLRADAQDLVAIAESLDMALSAAQDAQESAQVGVSETESTRAETQLADGGIEVSGNDIAYPADVDTLYSLRTLRNSDYVKERDKAAKQLSARLGISIEQANKYIDDISGVAAMIAADQSRLDFEAEPAFSALKKNSEYKWTVDFSTLCKKRLLYTGTFDTIQEQMADAILTEEDYIKLRDMMAQKGYEVACAFCYVESRRKNNGEIIDKFLDVYKKAQRDGTKMELGASNRRRAFATEAGFTPTIADFNTTNGILNIMHNHKSVYDAYMYFMNARGTSKPKLIETRTEYNSEILRLFRSKNAVNAMIKRGGLRLQSFSDFEVVNLLDMMQVVYDMSRVGLTSQAYTKVPAFARVFGQTGIKINESLVVKGLDANGQLIFDDVEGMPHEEAFRIREMYPENVGTILVGKDDATIRAAMADPRIDFIIPYHRSGWSETNMQALGIKGYTDYTKSQNEISQTGEKIKNFYPSEYWDYSKSGDENAQIYLEKCAESRRTPKFPQFAGESGYWKTLIDFKMYDNNGNGAPQRPVTPDVNLTEARRVLDEYNGGHRTLPVAQDVVQEFVEWYRENRTGNEASEGTKFSLKDSEAFKKWFGDSKVVDKKGNPLVVYHATDSEFNVFDRSKLGDFTSGNTDWRPAVRSAQIGFWFSDHDLAATVFTDPDKTKAVYLSIQKPYRTKLDSLWNALEHTRPETYVKRLQERGYDGLRVQDSEFGGVSYVAFEPTQIKSATNNSGAFDPANPDIRFSLKSPVEETKDLIAVHNLSEENLQKLLKLGGLPAPSIAIARAEFGYRAYGPISLVFDKNSIDPEANDKNRVYGADAWTPVVPSDEEFETPEDVVREMYAAQVERGEERYLLDPETLQALAAPEYKSIDDIKDDSGRLGYVNPYEHGYEVRNLNRQLNDVINRLVDDYDFAESDAEASIRRAATLEHNIDTVIESFASEEDGYHIDEGMAQEIIDLYEAAAAIPTEFFEAKPQRAVRFDEVKAAIVPESTSESLKNELKERVEQVIEYADGDEQARLEALNSLEEVKFSLKDTSEVDEQAKALLDGVDVELNADVVKAYARSALRAADKDAAKINQQVRQAAGKILKDTASKYDRKTLESNMRAIVEAYARDGGEGVSQAAAEMAKAIIEKNTHLDTTLRDQYSALRRDLRENGVSLTEIQKAEAASIYGSYNEFRRALMGTVKLTDKSMTLEARWDELSTMYPEIFPADTVEGDQINALMAFKQMMQPVYTNDFGMDMDTAAVDLGLRIQGDALSIAGAKEASKQLYGSAQKIENRVKKAYDAELKAQKKAKVAQFQAIAERLADAKKLGDTQGYDNAMADYRNLIRKETGVKMPGGESISPSAKMRFSQLAEDMQAAREANDTASYQEAYKAYKELLKKERIQSTVVAPAVQDALNLARARFKANQEAKEGTVKKQKATQRVIKQAKALVDMLGNKKKGVRVPRMMQDNLLTLLEGLDINGRGAANKGEVTKEAAAMREQLTALRQTYQAIWDDQAKGEAPKVLDGLMMVINEEQRAQLDDALSILEQGGHFTLRSMTTEQLKALGDALMTVKQTISTIGVLWRKGRYQNVAELADASIQEMGKRPDARLNAVAGLNAGRDFLALDMLEPVSYGERLGQAGSEIIQGLYEGEREKFGRLREAQTAAAAMMKDADVTSYDIGRWRNHVNTVRMGGHDVKLTDTQAMDIYLTAMRPQGKQHMLGNGIRLKTSKQTGAQVFTVRMTEADIAKVSDLLSDQQKRMAHKLQEYLAGDVAKWGNDVTQQLYLYDYFTEKTYWPLTSDPNVLKSKEPTTDFRLDALTNPGFLKPLKAGANNAVIIMDAFDVFNRHVAEMASYSGLAMPMIDAVNYLNYKQHDDAGLTTGGVKESMERLLGSDGQKYMTRLLQDLNHARHGDDLLALSKLGALYKKAAVTGKIRVVLQQPTAIARAAQEISPVYLAQGLKLGNKADIAEMEQHSALAWWKNNGSGMDIGVGRSADQVLWGNTSKAQTAMDKIETAGGLIDANKADAVTWAAMWRAVKRETQRIHPELQVGSEAYFRTVAERFDGIMDRTQVVDSVMHRSQIMRSQNGLVKELTAFKAEPIKSYNMLARAAMELGRNPKSRAAQAAVTRSVLVFAANAALTALAEALFDVFKHRDDDDRLMEYLLDAKKGFLKEYTDEFLGSWLDNMNVIDLIPFATQAKDVLLNNDAPEMMSFDGLVSLRKAALTFNDHFVGENKQKTTTYGAIAPVLKAASQITGLPIAGIMANTEMLAKIADPQWLNYKAVSGKFADNYEALYAAILEGDKRAITRIRGRLAADTQGKSAKSPAQIDQGVANVLAEKDERIAQAYQLRKEGKSTQLVALKKQIIEDGFTDAMVSAAINRYESQAKAQEKTTQENDMDAQLTAKLFNYENLYAAIRTGSIEDVGIIAEYLQANSTAKDPAAAIRSQVSGEFKQEYLDAVMNGGSAESLKQKLLSLGLTEDDLNSWVKDARYAELKESMGEGDIADAKQTAMELIDSGADVSNVVKSLNSKYRPLYVELVNSGRTAEAEKLQKDLESLGLIKKKTGQNYYRKDYMDKWVTDYNNKNK